MKYRPYPFFWMQWFCPKPWYIVRAVQDPHLAKNHLKKKKIISGELWALKVISISFFFSYLNYWKVLQIRSMLFVFDSIDLVTKMWKCKLCKRAMSCKFLLEFTLNYDNFITNELPHDKTNKMTCASSEDSDQPVHLLSLIAIFAVRKRVSAQRRLIRLGVQGILFVLSCTGSNINPLF